jgi:hypothetical protein
MTTGYSLKFRGLIPCSDMIFLFFIAFKQSLGPIQSPIRIIPVRLSLGSIQSPIRIIPVRLSSMVKRQEREDDRSGPFSAKIYTSTLA